jgi:hypothetical protein
MEDYEISELKRRLAGLLEERQMWRQTHMSLTDEERNALEFAVETCRVATHDAVTLRRLLERLK